MTYNIMDDTCRNDSRTRLQRVERGNEIELFILITSLREGHPGQTQKHLDGPTTYSSGEIKHHTRLLIEGRQLRGQITGLRSEIVGRPTAAGVERLREAGMI